MFKLLLLCLLATLVTSEEPKGSHSTATSSTEAHHESSPEPHPESSRAPDARPDPSNSEHTTPPTAHQDHSNPEHSAAPTGPLTCNCTGCPDNHCTTGKSKRFCVSMAETNNFDGVQTSENRSCLDDIQLCNTSITFTLNETFYWRSHTECCHDADNCNARPIDAPPKDTALGKLECPSCFVVNEDSCKPIRMKCAASETKCIDVAGTIKHGDKTEKFVGKGCATRSAEHIRSGTTLTFGNATYHFMKSHVTDGTSQIPRSVPFIFLLSGFVVLLQAKFIY